MCVGLVALVMTSFETLGGDCGDAPSAAGDVGGFHCNAPAYVLMAVWAAALAGLSAMLVWGVVDLVGGWRDRRR